MVAIIDFEASGLGSGSFPIEVAWNTTDGQVESYMISPETVSAWRDWSTKAEALHGLSHDELVVSGKSPDWVCRRLIEGLRGRRVLSDNPGFDAEWLSRLFKAARVDNPGIVIEDLGVYLFSEIEARGLKNDETLALKTTVRDVLKPGTPRKHRAGADVQALFELVQRVIVNPARTGEPMAP